MQNVLSGAIIIGNLQLVEYLLNVETTRADINGETPFFGKPLHIAAAWGHADIVEYLLDKGADIRAICSYPTHVSWDEELEYLNEERRHAYRCPDDTLYGLRRLGATMKLSAHCYHLSISRLSKDRETHIIELW